MKLTMMALAAMLLGLAACTADTAGGLSAGDTLAPDTTAPTVKLLAPLEGQRVTGDVVVEVEASDDREVEVVQIAIDGRAVIELGASPYVWTWPTDGLADGPYQITAVALDKAGNVARDSVRVNLISSQGCQGEDCDLQVSLVSPRPGEVVQNGLRYEASIVSTTPVTGVQVQLDAQLVDSLSSAPWSGTLDTSGLPSGEHVLTMIAANEAGQSASATERFVIDRPPSVAFITPTPDALVREAVRVEVAATDDVEVSDLFMEIEGARVGEFTDEGLLTWMPQTRGEVELVAVAIDSRGQRTQARRRVTVTDDMALGVVLERCDPTCRGFENGENFLGQERLRVSFDPANANVDKVEYFLGPRSVASSGSAPFEVTLDMTQFRNAAAELRAVAEGPGLYGEASRLIRIANPPQEDCDVDGDSVLSLACEGLDCDDFDADVFPCPNDPVGICADRDTDARNCGGCGNICGTGLDCVQGACICTRPECEEGDPNDYNFEVLATWFSDIEVVEGTVDADDIDGDGTRDNSLTAVLGQFASVFDVDINDNFDRLIADGELNIGATWPTLSEGGLSNRNDVDVDFFDLEDADGSLQTRDVWNVTADSFVPGTQVPRVIFRDGVTTGNNLSAGPAPVFRVTIPFGGIQLELRVRDVRIRGELRRDGPGLEVRGGILTGYVTLENLLEGFNLFADSPECDCLNLNEPLVDLSRGMGASACLQVPNNTCGFLDVCNILAGGCGFLVRSVSANADIDSDGDGINDAFSAAFRWEGEGARFRGVAQP